MSGCSRLDMVIFPYCFSSITKKKIPVFLLSMILGKRKCLGESVAKSTIFLFLANLLAKFTFEMDKKDDPPSVLPVGGLTIGPQPFNAIVSPRNLYF